MFNNTSIKILSKLGLTYCAYQIIIRFILFFLSAQDVSWKLRDVLRTLSIGFAFDIVVALCLLVPLCLLLLFVGNKLEQKNWARKLIQLFVLFFFGNMVFTSVCEYYFWEEFHTRFNFIAVDYLVYTHELINNITQSYPVVPLMVAVGILSLLLTVLFFHYITFACDYFKFAQRIKYTLFYGLVVAIGLLGLRADFTCFASENRYNQEITGNGIFQLFHAFFNNELEYERFYLHKDNQQILSQLQEKLALDGSLLIDRKGIRRQKTSLAGNESNRPNIVVITVESLSAKFTGFVDKKSSLTPYLDELAEKSYTFNRVYATGTRTVRGLEAISLSLPPTPGQSIVRRPDSNNLYNISSPLRELGYQAQFVYGGYGYFDNMNGFYKGNGFDVFDHTDIPKEDIFCETVWGVADEILFKHALKQLDNKIKQGPAFQLILTTTNHRPYIFPEGRINAPQKERNSVVKYTDWAIHQFLEEAKTKPWFDNTVFVIIADHNASVAGNTGLPISKYHIPCIVYAPKLIKHGKNTRLMSQIDVMPSIFGMLGMDYKAQHMGYDMNKLPLGKERAFIATYQEIGYIAEDKLIVLKPNNKVSAYKIEDFTADKYIEITPPKNLIDDAITWYQGASYLYKNKLLKIAK